MINKYIEIYYDKNQYLGYISLNCNNKPLIYFTHKNLIKNYNKFGKIYKITINKQEYIYKLFSGHLYFINLISLNFLYYIPIDIRKIIWKYLNIHTL